MDFLFPELNDEPQQPELPPPPPQTAEEAKHESMAAVLAACDPEWITLAVAALQRIARRQQFLTSDDVWQELGDKVPREPRALGPIMSGQSKHRIIQKTDRVTNSQRVENHGRPVTIWESLVFQGAQ